ncbi:MAG: acyltransferase family protein, partial [Mycobacteriales bacterium]
MAVPRPGSALDAADDRSGERRSAVGESVPSAYGPSAYVPRIRPMSAPRRAPLRVVPDGRTPAEQVRRPLPGPGPPRSERRRYVPALDGLRAIAVAAVVAYHLGFGWARGGYFGVDVFFVLSGYLITDGLLTGRRRRGAVDLASFWVGRARRLLPALVVMLIVVAAAATAMARGTLGALRGDTLAAVTYTSNWWQIWRAHSYFTAIGSTSPLTHLWSLAVEEQFYLLWPILLAAAMRWLPRRVIVQATLGGAVFSAVAMGVLYRGTRDPTRVYVGTDTHATALLLGAALAFGWPLLAPAPGLTRPGRRLLSLGGLAAAVGLGACVHLVHGQGIVEYRGLFAVVAVLSAVVIAAAAHPATALGRCLGVAPLRWIGARSYGIYLWHYPVIVLSRTAFGTAASRLPAQLIQATLAVGLAAASWRLVEKPIKLHGFAGPVRRVLSFTRSLRRPGAWQAATATGVGGVVAVALVGLTLAPGPGSSVDRVKAQIAAGRRIAAESQQRAVQQQTGQRGTGQRGTGQRGTGQRGTGRPGTARQGSGRAGAGG